MNNVDLIGRLTRDPDVRYNQNQTAVARFSLAINSGYGDNERTDYPNIVVFGKQAENCEKYLSKGRLVAVSGRIQTGSYTNKDGATVYTTDVVASRVEFLGGGSQEKANRSEYHEQQQMESVPQGFEALDEDLPF